MTDSADVLVVDDDTDVRDTVAEALSGEGYRTAVAAGGRDALDKLAAGLRPRVILLDMMMPGMDGWTFRAEQQKDPELALIPVIVFTAYGVPREAAEQLGAQAFLKKPVRLDDLLRVVGRFVGR